MTRRSISILVIALALVVVAGTAFARGPQGAVRPSGPEGGPEAGPPMMGPGGGGFWNDPRMVEQLGLTDEQIARLEELAAAQREEMEALKPELDATRDALDEVLFTTPGDEDAVSAAANALADLQQSAFLTMVRHRAAIHAVLTAEQLSILKDARPPFPNGSKGPRVR
jgi:Spy/CpxP family protein refolding chaperone